MSSRATQRLNRSVAFLAAAQTYWLTVFPHARREIERWRRWAQTIPDPQLRRLAAHTHRTKWLNLEGAAAFATFAPATHRSATTRMLVSFQAAYDYADTISEQPTDDPIANGCQLHQALLVALDPAAVHPDYYEHSRSQCDGGYLAALADSCRVTLQQMPSRHLVGDRATRAAAKIATYQSLNHNIADTSHEKLALWATQEASNDIDIRWWETSAAYASSLTILALLAASADSSLSLSDVCALERAYHPWIGGLHTMLDSLADWSEDRRTGQPSLLDRYNSSSERQARVQMLARRAKQSIEGLPRARRHEVVLAAMVGVYLVAPDANSRQQDCMTTRILKEIGDLATPALIVLRLRRGLRQAD